MSETKWTAGPWIGAGPSFGDPLPRYTTEIVTEWEDENEESQTICEFAFHHHDDENEANARLIAAAPELYAALMECAARIYVDEGVNSPTFQKARAALAKARGE